MAGPVRCRFTEDGGVFGASIVTGGISPAPGLVFQVRVTMPDSRYSAVPRTPESFLITDPCLVPSFSQQCLAFIFRLPAAHMVPPPGLRGIQRFSQDFPALIDCLRSSRLIFSFKTPEHLKVTTVRGGKGIDSPVWGFRPVRWCFRRTQNLPKPLMRTSSPRSSDCFINSKSVSMI